MRSIITLEQQFKQELSIAKNANMLHQQLHKIINYLGRSDYSLLRLDATHSHTGEQCLTPKLLLCSHSNKPNDRHCILSRANMASLRNRHLAMLYHFIACTPADSAMLSPQRIQYILITSTGLNDYYITPSDEPLSSEYTLNASLNISEKNPPNKEDTEHALHILIKTISHIGSRYFPELFLRGSSIGRVTMKLKTQKLLHALALEDATLHQVAEQLGLTIYTVNKHMATAKAALGTKTIAGTIWRALNEGLI